MHEYKIQIEYTNNPVTPIWVTVVRHGETVGEFQTATRAAALMRVAVLLDKLEGEEGMHG